MTPRIIDAPIPPSSIEREESEESLEWSKLRISIDNGTERMDCSKGNFTSNEIGKSKVSPKLSSDGVTFTVMIDATSEDEFTYLDIFDLVEGNPSNFNLRFSKTDILFIRQLKVLT